MKLEDDGLERSVFLNDLFNIFENFGNQDGKGLTIVINGKYGTGKSTLLDFIEEENEKDKKYNVLKYDSWENNLFDNPLIPILYTISKIETKGGKIKNGAKNILKKIPKMLFSTLANAHSIDLQEICTNENIFDEYDAYNKALLNFKKLLSDYCKSKKTIFLVDELDRCLPEYQIKVLESVYHMLDIPNLIVVIALDREQLEKAISNMFGENTDTYGYMSKFINYEIDLPNKDSYDYIQSLMTFSSEHEYEVKNLISEMCKCIDLSLRDCKQIIKELNMHIKESRDGWGHRVPSKYFYSIMLSFVLIIKKINHKIYLKYFSELKERHYINGKIKWEQSCLYKFINDIKNSEIEKIINLLKRDNFSRSALAHIIELFDDLKILDEEDISKFLNFDINQIQGFLKEVSFDVMVSYPKIPNDIIERAKILKSF